MGGTRPTKKQISSAETAVHRDDGKVRVFLGRLSWKNFRYNVHSVHHNPPNALPLTQRHTAQDHDRVN